MRRSSCAINPDHPSGAGEAFDGNRRPGGPHPERESGDSYRTTGGRGGANPARHRPTLEEKELADGDTGPKILICWPPSRACGKRCDFSRSRSPRPRCPDASGRSKRATRRDSPSTLSARHAPKIIVDLNECALPEREGKLQHPNPAILRRLGAGALSARFQRRAGRGARGEKEPARALTSWPMIRSTRSRRSPLSPLRSVKLQTRFALAVMRRCRCCGRGARLTGHRKATPGFLRGGWRLMSDFVFCTGQYSSGDWTGADAAGEHHRFGCPLHLDRGGAVGAIRPALFGRDPEYPFVYLTGHLPFRFSGPSGGMRASSSSAAG